MSKKVLIIEDDEEIGLFIEQGLQEVGYETIWCKNGEDGLLQGLSESNDVIILDRMLPKIDGLQLLGMLKASGKLIPPILVLSALGDVEDRVEGLQKGADDYLAKPFVLSELIARVEALMRRMPKENTQPTTFLQVDDLSIDLIRREVSRAGQVIELQHQEFKLLEYLMRHANQVVSRSMLLEGVWSYHFDPQTNVIDVHISRLRQKIDKEFNKPLLHTIRGTGYLLGVQS